MFNYHYSYSTTTLQLTWNWINERNIKRKTTHPTFHLLSISLLHFAQPNDNQGCGPGVCNMITFVHSFFKGIPLLFVADGLGEQRV